MLLSVTHRILLLIVALRLQSLTASSSTIASSAAPFLLINEVLYVVSLFLYYALHVWQDSHCESVSTSWTYFKKSCGCSPHVRPNLLQTFLWEGCSPISALDFDILWIPLVPCRPQHDAYHDSRDGNNVCRQDVQRRNSPRNFPITLFNTTSWLSYFFVMQRNKSVLVVGEVKRVRENV